jgi:hypothetical protein
LTLELAAGLRLQRGRKIETSGEVSCRVRGNELVQKPGRGELAIRARESPFARDCDDRWILIDWIVDSLRIPKRCIGVEKMIRERAEKDIHT